MVKRCTTPVRPTTGVLQGQGVDPCLIHHIRIWLPPKSASGDSTISGAAVASLGKSEGCGIGKEQLPASLIKHKTSTEVPQE